MYFNPLTQFVRSLITGKRRLGRRVRRPLRDRERRRMGIGSWTTIAAPAEFLEERAMLSGPQLVTIAPNTGGFLANGQLTTEAPKELTFTFSPGTSIDQNTLAAGISITRSGNDNTFGNGNDQTITPGFMGVAVSGNGQNQVTLRFADTLADDSYRISITGALKSTTNESFNGGITQTLDFKVDYGSQVVSLVPQPVLRTANLTVANFGSITDLDTFSITAGGAPVTFQFKDTATGSVVGAGNTAILYSAADTATSLATAISNAINTRFGVNGAVAATPSGASVALTGDAFTPTVKVTTAQAGALSLTDGALVQKRDTIVAYFNQNALDPARAQDPGYYQAINTADGTILLPTSVTYDSASNTAVLKFAADLPAGTFHLTIGAPNLPQGTLSTAVVVGTVFGNTGGYSTTGYLGNSNQTSTATNDIDLFQFRTLDASTVTIDASHLASGLGGAVLLRLFDVNGVEIANSGSNTLVANLPAGGTYYVGVSSTGNAAYNPVTGANAVNGAGFGSYRLGISSSNNVALNNDTTSFSSSTNLGTLGAAGQTINDVIAPLGNLAYPQLPGSNDEPGHRDIPLEENNGAGYGVAPTVPGAIATYYYNFQDIYGTDPQGNILHNAITENQKQRAREILDIYANYLGVEFVETLGEGLTIITGDVRAVSPTIPPDSVGGISEGSMFGRVIMNASLNYGNSEYGGNWFSIAFHEIGHSLGLEHSYHAPSVMGQGLAGVEPVFPGDVNLVPAMRINPPQSTDINLYKFNVDQPGVFSAETIAQRLTDANGLVDPSLFDSVITLYKETAGVRTIVARNDDYFGKDSFINLRLETGTYFLAISSTGNTSFDPSVSDTGFGGRTDGNYRLKLNFTADPAPSTTLNDVAGVALDGDGNAATGGVFNFWFQSNTAANTIFVDKTNSADPAQDGTIGHAYSTIAAALTAATPGTVIRIVGNGGTDGDASTLGDNKAYVIGFDSQGNPAQDYAGNVDGTEFKIPQGVTVMIDAGAILKLQGAIVDVGNSVPGIDRSGSSLQVLGTPDKNVYFTSLRNNAIGGNTDPTNFTGVQAGNWGGLVFRQASDFQGLDYRNNGIFLNSVNQASISYGGGQVFADSVLQVFNPIHLSNPDQSSPYFARPAIWNNTITLNADAAISADPNSFYNSLDRVGPEIHGNKVLNNTINGLFIRVSTPLGQGIEKLEVPARIDENDITYVLTENLLIEGTPGGPYLPNPFDPDHIGWDARVAGSLIIDPGVVLKLSGAHIEAQVGGSQLIAEGTLAHPVIFTSLRDDTYGAGGAFDTGNDGTTSGVAADWGGLFFNATSSGSIDNAVIQFGGGFQFNAIEIQQADVRVANTLFQNNANGDAGGSNRNGLLSNGPATIFVRGAQPAIVNNIFVNNAGNVLSVNANALNALSVADWGRSTGALDAFTQFVNNHGPLVRLNRYSGNGTNGMEVRGEILTTETIWDDTDIVHVVRTEIRDTINLHTYGGIRLQSSVDASLVVKLLGANAGFTINGTPLDIDDRIGGTLHVVGTPGHPVILTSLNDDSVGAGFLPNGQPSTDTDNDGSATPPQPGDWRSLLLDRYSNDRNVAIAIENEQIANQLDTNGAPAAAEFLGNLAPNMPSDNADNHKAGNDDQPLGFAVHGFLNKPTDVDVYSFNAAGRTEVWFDIGRTTTSLDTILELVDANGVVVASSNDSQNDATLGGSALSLIKDEMLGGDFYTVNPRDAGFRVVLPGPAGVTGTYFIRVKSNGGLTSGEYRLQVRLQQVYEHPGSTVRYADIRYAVNGIEILGMPGHSPLGGESASVGGNNSFGSAQELGNLLTSDRNTISVAGSLANRAQVDWYKFSVNYDLIQAIGGVNGGAKTWSTIFDIDYADGIARPDTIISVFDSSGRLILVSRDSNITDDQPGALQGNGLTDISRGSVGKLDPYIGSVQLPTGTPGGGGNPSFTYYVAISSNAQLPAALDGTFNSSATNSLVRLEPVSSVRRIVEDHIGFSGYSSGGSLVGTLPVQPTTPAILPIATTQELSTTVRPFTLSDVALFVSTNGHLYTIDPFYGATEVDINNLTDISDIAIRSDGTLWGTRTNVLGDNVAGQLVSINPGTAAQSTIGADGILDFVPATPTVEQTTSSGSEAFAYHRVGIDNTNTVVYDLYYAVRDDGGNYGGGSRLYRANPANGSAAVVQGQPWGVRGTIGGAGVSGFTTGMAFVNGTLYGVSDDGQFYSIDTGSGAATYIGDYVGMSFTGLTIGPQNVEGGVYANLLFATTSDGRLVCIDPVNGDLLPVFEGGATEIDTFIFGATGLAFSPLDVNLWHPTERRTANDGHGIDPTFDNSRSDPQNFLLGLNGRASTQAAGGASFYFGLEQWTQTPDSSDAYFTYDSVNAQYGALTSDWHRDLTTNPAVANIGNNYNLPGGAQGSLITNSFSLAGYSNTDKPTLYYNYFLDTENFGGAAGDPNGLIFDSARVFVTADDGVTWFQLATNNSKRSTLANTYELPTYNSTSSDENPDIANQRVQEMFDDTNVWRQARVDLSDFAGLGNLKLRFDFSTAGAAIEGDASEGLPGDVFGSVSDDRRLLNNANEGFYIDDIIIGLAERGEMVTGANAGQTNFFGTTQAQDVSAGFPSKQLTGAYELEIRRGTEYAFNPARGFAPIVIYQQFDSNDRLVSGFSIQAPVGSTLVDGQTIVISDGVKTLTFEFDLNNSVDVNNRRIAFSLADSDASVARSIRNAINNAASAGLFRVTASLGDDSISGSASTNTRVDLYQATSVLNSSASSTEQYQRLGDRNLPRQQGAIQISSNTIRNVSQAGIVVDSGQRDGANNANLPHPGSVLNGPTLNNEKLVPGPQIANNVIYNFGQVGIRFSGDGNAAGAVAAAPYGRIVNNTIYGGATFVNKNGIVVSDNAAPTIINNIVANTALGVSIDASSSARTVLRTTLFKNNTNNGVEGLDKILLGAADPLFVNAATGNFYLAPASKAIDSSLNIEQDRASIIAVKSPLDIPQSPVTAPAYDRFGQLRIDDPSTPNALGLGLNIFKDRGALERADFVGPSAGLVVPLDNGPDDGEPAVGTFFMTTPVPLTEIGIELTDLGIGIDPATVTSSAFVLKQDGVTLVDGVDYIYSYNPNTGRVAFLSVSAFPSNDTYTINLDTSLIKDFAGNALQGNQPDGSSLFTIIGNGPPTLTAIATLPGLKNIPLEISYATLLANSDLSVVTGHTPQFRIESIANGSLTITHLGVTNAVVPGTTLFVAGDTLTWTPPPTLTGVTPAFTVVGYDPENALIAPDLQLSSPPVSVNVDLVNVGPVLTTISTLPGALEDTDFFIDYATLKAASDLSDQNNDDPLSFQIIGVLAGSTLEISDGGGAYAPVVVGTTLFGPGDTLKWKAPLNQNNELNGNNPFNAFAVLATDGLIHSPLPPVLVPIDVAPVADPPTMTTLAKFGLGGLNSQFPILYSDLLSHSDAQNVDGHPIQFRIESIAAGATLQIKHLGVVSTVVPGTATAIVVDGDSLFWTPPLNVFGASVPAFDVVAFDSVNAAPNDASTPAVTATVEVINSPAPTLTTLATFVRPRFIPTPLTFADLQGASNVTVAAGHTLGFRIESLTSGSLSITHLGVTSAAGIGTVVVAGDTLTWTSAPGATGLADAFEVLAIDLTNTLTSLDPVQVRVNLVNFAPTLSTVSTFGGGIQQTPYNISYSSLLGAANEFDANNDLVRFRIRSVQNGTLTITKSGTSTPIPIVVAQTLVEPGDVLTWTGAGGAIGNNLPAFAVRAFDGTVGSGVDIQVAINVAPFGSQFSLSGPWVVGGKLARINQTGASLTYSGPGPADGAVGSYTSFNTVTRGGLVGTVDTSTPDNGRIVWSDGTIWLKLSVGGQYYIPTAGNALVKVIQNGVALKFYNRFNESADATFISPTLISIPAWSLTATYVDGALNISNGVTWKKLDLSPSYTESVSGQKVGVVQTQIKINNVDFIELVFTDTVGGTSKGFWNSPTQVTASDWNSIGTVMNGQIVWAGGVRNGEIWNKNLVVIGTGSGAGPGFVSITATHDQILLTNKAGNTMNARIIDPFTLFNIDTGKTIIRKNGRLELGNGVIWGDFDFNALDAVFSDIKTFPFGS